ncbi:RICIN domain-containing protein [Hamadaea tsunoensis]|uniref:RICIN domain-containing protein n=1 Tax=Hamadaea tsunoensis TaxID=53368 RepID=UPI0004007FB0|nr:RICIN domain-containing protein [Hamadaea tsunoensis]
MRRSRLLAVLVPLLAVLAGGTVAVLTAPTAWAAAAFTSTAVNGNGGNCLDLPNGSTANGTQLIQWGCNGGTNQSFTFTPVAGTTDQYTIGTAAAGKCVDVYGASTADNATVIQWGCSGANNQKFRLVTTGADKTFTVQALHSGKCVVPAGGSATANTGVVQLPCGTAASRTWRLAGFPGTSSPPPSASPSVTPTGGTPPARTVRVFWLKPSDVAYDQRYPDGIAAVMREAQNYYRQELGKTFTLNSVVVEVVNGDHVRSWYENTPNGGDKYWWSVTNMQNELARKFALNNPDSRWLCVGEISAEGDGAGGGGSPGWVVLSGHDADGAAGVSGQSMNRWYGGMVHELGHAFGLPDAASTDGTPMSASFYSYPNTHFSQAQKNSILAGPYGTFLS